MENATQQETRTGPCCQRETSRLRDLVNEQAKTIEELTEELRLTREVAERLESEKRTRTTN